MKEDRPWSEEEIAYLKQEKKRGTSYAKIGEVLNRSKGSIVGQINRLGLCDKKPSPQRQMPYLHEFVKDWRYKRDHPW